MTSTAIKGVLSFCLFGSDPRYLVGMERNLALAPKIYPGWDVIVYVGDDLPLKVADSLVAHATISTCTGMNPMLARFKAAEDREHTHFLIRDADSRLSRRERLAVDEWLASGADFHIIRDHPGHSPCIGGGLWGGKCGLLPMSDLISAWRGPKGPGARDSIYNHDQLFLRDSIWPLIKDRHFAHDLCYRHIFPGAHPFPATFDDLRFVGEVFDADDRPDPYGWQRRLNWLCSQLSDHLVEGYRKQQRRLS